MDLDKGDCIDCGLCVQVCPTGIDIREGTQLECVNCTACIDSCNEVMGKINRAPNLIGFYTQDFISSQTPFRLGLKAYGYAAVLVVVVMVFSSLIYKRQDVETTVLRASGTLYQLNDDGTVSNLYNAELINKTNHAVKFTFQTSDPTDRIKFIQPIEVLPKEGSTHLTFFLIKKQKGLTDFKTNVVFEVIADGKVISTATTNFFSQP